MQACTRTRPCRTMKVLFLSLKPSPRYCENSAISTSSASRVHPVVCARMRTLKEGVVGRGSRRLRSEKGMAEAHLPSKEEARFSGLTNLRNRIFIMRHGQVSGPIGSVSTN